MDNIRVKEESLNNWRSGFEIEEGKKKGLDGKACWDGYKLAGTKKKGGKTVDNCVKEDQVDEGWKLAAGAAALAVPYLAKKFLKPKTDKLIDGARKKSPIGGDRRSGIVTESYNTSDWRNEFHPTEIESIDIIKNEPLVNEGNRTRFKGISISGSGNKKDMSLGPNEKALIDYSKIRASKDSKKETVAASYEADLENLIVEILEGDIQAMYEHGFSYQEVSEFYDIEEDLTEAWGALARGAFQGAKILATKVAPKVATYVKNRGIKDIKTVAKFARNPQNWARANKDIDKVGKFVKELPARTYQSGKALRGRVNKGLLDPAKKTVGNIKAAKRGGDLAVIRQQIKGNIATNNPRIQAASDKFLKSKNKIKAPKWDPTVPKPQPSNTPSTKRLTSPQPHEGHPTSKGLTYQQKQSRATGIIAKLQGKTPKQQKAKELTSRMKNAIDKSKKATTYSGKVDAAKKLPDPQSAIVKGGSTAVTTTKVVGKTTKLPVTKTEVINPPKANLTKVKSPAKPKTIDVKASEVGKGSKATQSKIKNAKEWMALNKRASVPSDAVTGNPNPPKFTGGKGSLRPKVTVSKNKLLGKVATGVSGVAGLTAGVKVGQKAAKTDSPPTPPTKKDKAIAPPINPKGVIPDEENKTISNTEKKTVNPKKNTVIKSKTEKEKKDENRAKVKANTEKYLKKTKDKIKKYGTSGSHLSPLEQEMAEGVAAVASKLPWGKIAGAAMTAVGAKGILQSKKSDPAFDHVFGKLKDKYGDGVIGKGETAKPWGTPKQQADAKAKKDKADKEEAAFQKRNPPVTSGRYPKDDKAAQDAARKAEAATPKRGLKDKRQSKRQKFNPDSHMTKNQQKRMKQAGLM
tara:strand:- start:490 stop:3063 length:2574 start_codon:yes stop_codon:yes gene_type:complete